MAVAVTNVTLTPNGGWTDLTTANTTTFLRMSKLPKYSTVFLAFGSSAPANTVAGGFRWACEEIFFQGALADKVYARVQHNSNDNVVVSVFNN
jgi:hypothetical protein